MWRFYLCAIPGTSQKICLAASSSIGSWSMKGLGYCCVCSFYYGSHYSSMGIVLFYLLRLEPFTSFHRQLQVLHSWCVYLWPGILGIFCQSLNIVISILMVICWWIRISSCHMDLISATWLFCLYHYVANHFANIHSSLSLYLQLLASVFNVHLAIASTYVSLDLMDRVVNLIMLTGSSIV